MEEEVEKWRNRKMEMDEELKRKKIHDIGTGGNGGNGRSRRGGGKKENGGHAGSREEEVTCDYLNTHRIFWSRDIA